MDPDKLGSSATATTTNKALVVRQYNQVLINNGLLKSDLQTISGQHIVPELSKLAQDNAESDVLAETILEQLCTALEKNINIMTKLCEEIQAEKLKRFPPVLPPSPVVNLPEAVSPPIIVPSIEAKVEPVVLIPNVAPQNHLAVNGIGFAEPRTNPISSFAALIATAACKWGPVIEANNVHRASMPTEITANSNATVNLCTNATSLPDLDLPDIQSDSDSEAESDETRIDSDKESEIVQPDWEVMSLAGRIQPPYDPDHGGYESESEVSDDDDTPGNQESNGITNYSATIAAAGSGFSSFQSVPLRKIVPDVEQRSPMRANSMVVKTPLSPAWLKKLMEPDPEAESDLQIIAELNKASTLNNFHSYSRLTPSCQSESDSDEDVATSFLPNSQSRFLTTPNSSGKVKFMFDSDSDGEPKPGCSTALNTKRLLGSHSPRSPTQPNKRIKPSCTITSSSANTSTAMVARTSSSSGCSSSPRTSAPNFNKAYFHRRIPPQPVKGKPKIQRTRRFIVDGELEKSTREAGKDEENRKRRLAGNKKMYNQFFAKKEGETFTELVLGFDRRTKQRLISVDSSIVVNLKEHQVNGVKFLWDNCFESIEAIKAKKSGGGCILAHCMGLGKTLQVIAFLHTVMTSAHCQIKRVLVLCPLNTVGNWVHEIQNWCAGSVGRLDVHKLWESKGSDRIQALYDWEVLGGVGILNYDGLRALTTLEDNKKKSSVRDWLKVKSSLFDPGPDIVICDEGHLLKNSASKVTQAAMKIKTPRRVILTGTPVQNNLMEYYTMMEFVKPKLLGTKHEFRNRFVNPIKKGQLKDSTNSDVSFMKRRAHVLHKILDGCVQRLDYSVLVPYLPPKFEYALSINLSQVQKDLYTHYLNLFCAKETGIGRQLLPDFHSFGKICTHPIVLTYKALEEEPSLLLNDDSNEENVPPNRYNGTGIFKKEKKVPPGWFSTILSREPTLNNPELSGKMVVLAHILKYCVEIREKILIFSQFLTTLDLIENYLAQLRADPSANFGECVPNVDYFRIDGSVSVDERQRMCKQFNEDGRAKLFLISTRAGGLGINLTGANRVVIFDESWNPANDVQSIFRVYRFGQTKPCYVYRLLARGTMEEKIYNRQVVKLSLSCRVVDEQQIERHFHYDEVEELYDYDPEDDTERPVPAVPQDPLLKSLLVSDQWIFSYLEHDSLLQNMEDEELTEDERSSAWDDYVGENVRGQWAEPGEEHPNSQDSQCSIV